MSIQIEVWKPGMVPEDGKIYQDMPNETYHGFGEWNGSSMLKHALRSVESYLHEKTKPHKNTLALERGGALHLCMEYLVDGKEIDSFFNQNILTCSTKTILTASWCDSKDQYPDCYVLPEKERDAVQEMSRNIYKSGLDAEQSDGSIINLWESGYSELSFFWKDTETGIKCKCRPDWIDFDRLIMPDFKTTKNHAEDGFDREIANFFYHFSAAFYMEGVFQVTGLQMEHFMTIAAANNAPFEVEIYDIDWPSLQEGRAGFRKSLDRIANYEPNRRTKIKKIGLPRWAFKLTEPYNQCEE